MTKNLLLIAALVLAAAGAQAQEKDTSYWKKGGVAGLGFTNSGLSTYWQAGGINSQSIGGRLSMFANYNKDKVSWNNDLAMSLGAVRQGRGDSTRFLKNDDQILLNSKFGYRINPKLLVSGLLSFRTQFIEGYAFAAGAPTVVPSDTVSNFLSPAYLDFGLGLDWQPAENLSFFYTPVNSKVTIVGIEEYRPLYIPQNITTGPVRYEIGSRLGLKYRRELAKNINFQTEAGFFANYLQNFGNIDINWTTLTTAKVNNWLAITFATNLIYDDDIRFALVDELGKPTGGQGPRTQFQHVLNIGLTYTFLQ